MIVLGRRITESLELSLGAVPANCPHSPPGNVIPYPHSPVCGWCFLAVGISGPTVSTAGGSVSWVHSMLTSYQPGQWGDSCMGFWG